MVRSTLLKTKGMVHIYTGNGKGKTTAAFGMAVRALGHNKRVYVAQFMKAMKYGEAIFLGNTENIVIEQFGNSKHLLNTDDIDKEHLEAFKKGYNKVADIIKTDNYDIVILDEILVSHFFKLVTTSEIINLINMKHENTELVLTGRYAPSEIYDYADLISEIKEVKHYYNTYKTPVREGIEN